MLPTDANIITPNIKKNRVSEINTIPMINPASDSPPKLVAISEFFGVSIDYLAGLES